MLQPVLPRADDSKPSPVGPGADLDAHAGVVREDDFIRFANARYLEIKAEAMEKEQAFTLTEAEFVELYIGSMPSMVGGIVVLFEVLVLYMSLTAAGDDGENPPSGVRRLMIRTAKKLRNEFLFYLNPMEITRSINSPLPVIGLSTDLLTFTSAF
jgi:hypothetical protein